MQVVIGLIFIASLVGIAVQRFRMPYTVGLVIIGLGLALVVQQNAEQLEIININQFLIPEVILAILVPPLIFEAAFHIKFNDLRRYLREILTFAIPGVLITMLLVGYFISLGTGLPLEIALIFGALIAATDPVAVVALFRTLGVPKQLLILLEGESLFNDGTAIVIFNLMIAIALGVTEFRLTDFAADFILTAGGGLIAGLLVGWVISFIIRIVNNHLIEVTLTTVAAYGSYIVAEEFHVSGVLAVVAAGLVIGNIGEQGMSPTTRLSLFNFWEFGAYLTNSIAFLLIGLVIDVTALISRWQSILVAIAAVLAARALVIYLFSFRFQSITSKMRHVIYWGGLRGAISLALALSLPGTLGVENQTLLQDMTFGVVLFTLLVQGTSMRAVIKRLGFSARSKNQELFERHQARAIAAQRSYDRLNQMHHEGLISDHAWSLMEPSIQRQIELRKEVVHEIMHADPSVEGTELEQAFQEALRTQRSTYNSLLTQGVIDEETFAILINEVDAALVNQDISYGDLLIRRTNELPPIEKLIVASVSEPDVYEALHMLGILGIPTIRLSSILGPSGLISMTLLIGVEAELVDEVIDAIRRSSTTSVSNGNGLFGLLGSGGPAAGEQSDHAHIFIFDVLHYEEI